MANNKGGQPSQGKQAPFLVQIVTSSDVLHQLNAIKQTLDLLVENAGMGEQLRALTQKLRVSNEQLEADVEANQP